MKVTGHLLLLIFLVSMLFQTHHAFHMLNHPKSDKYGREINRHIDDMILKDQQDRRLFLVDSFKLATVSSMTGLAVALASPEAVQAADGSVNLKVTPLAHTFITSSGTAKPIRENDATRFFTNARVVYMFEGKPGASSALASEVTALVLKRKSERGPGVTPGSVHSMTTGNVDAVVAKARQLPEGDVLLVGPIPSGGTASDGKILTETANSLGSFVGGRIGGGVLSVLLDGPREGLKLVESGFPTSELLWYSLPASS